MKILSKSLILFSIVTLGFSACSENEQLADDSLSKVPVLLTTRLAAMDADATRAGVSLNESMLEKGNVGVWLSSVGYDTKYTYTAASGGALSSESPAYYPTSGTTDIVAVYPASAITADASQATAFAVLADQTVDANYEASDLMSGKLTEKSKTSGVQSIPLAHKMAKVIVNITPGAGVSSITSVTLNNIKRQITYTASTDVLGQAEQILGTDVSVGTNNCAAVIPPQTIAASTDFLTIVTDAGTAVYQFKTAKELLTGNYYQLNITVNRTATLGVNTIEAWDGSGSANVAATTTAGELELDDIDPITYDGNAHTPEPTVRFGETILTKETQYKLIYTNNTYAGTATVTAVGLGTYGGKMGMKEFTIEKAPATISYAPISITTGVGQENFTNELTVTGDGSVIYSSSNENVAIVHTNGEVEVVGAGTTSIIATVTDGNNYTYASKIASYTLNVGEFDAKLNPLWYVAEYNCTSGLGFESSYNAGYMHKWNDAMSKYTSQGGSAYDGWYPASKSISGAYWHLPTSTEWASLGVMQNIANLSGYKTDNYTRFGYNNDTKNAGVTDHSYWVNEGNGVIKAIRYIGTDYCSVWKYEFQGGFTSESYGHLEISSTLIGNVVTDTEEDAAEWWTSNGPGVKFSNSASGQQKRTFYARGGTKASTGSSATADEDVGTNGNYWSTTEPNAGTNDDAYFFYFTYNHTNRSHYGNSKNHGYNVRLFRDN